MGGTVRIERVGKLRAVGAKPVAEQLLQLPVEAFDPLADLFLIGGPIGRGIDREAAPGSLSARAEGDKTRQPAFDRVTRRRPLLEDALGVRDNAFVIAVENFQEQRILVAERGIEARLGEAGGGGDVIERCALESFSPEHVAREIQHLVGIETAGSCHRTYVRADRGIAKSGHRARRPSSIRIKGWPEPRRRVLAAVACGTESAGTASRSPPAPGPGT